jgi:hypothetical protein
MEGPYGWQEWSVKLVCHYTMPASSEAGCACCGINPAIAGFYGSETSLMAKILLFQDFSHSTVQFWH